MTKRNRDLRKRGTWAVTAGSGQVTTSEGRVTAARSRTVFHRVVPAHLACRIGAPARAGQRDEWPAVVAIALGSFALVFSELIPVGLLADISGHLRVSVGTGGLMVVVPAVAAAVAAPVLTLCSAGLERRRVLVGLSALVLVSDVIGGIAPGFGVMLAARVVLGIGVGGFWVFGAGAAINLVSERARGTAVAVVSSGIFIATVASLPAASLIGTLTTWRAAFAVAAVFAAVAVAAQLAAVPRLGGGGRVRPGSLLTVVTLPVSRIGLVAAGAIFFANFAAYTYIGPLLHTRAGLGASAITLVLLGFGLAGAAGNFTAGVTVRSHLRATLAGSGLLIACSALLLAAVTGARPLTIGLVAVWGLGFGAVPVAAQSWMARAMPANVEGGLALFVSALQGSLAAGSAAGGVVYDAKGPGGALVLAAAVAAAGSLALLGRAGASISSPLVNSADPAREQGRKAPAPSHDATGGAGSTVQRPR
ncbi:MAG TPA: MFS transporter [Streptosporangiaceae bacterium]|jgi:predicted MFS family arabinose efflux permease|nr:MFS transporter [Streptosporangiaceae bacterium]